MSSQAAGEQYGVPNSRAEIVAKIPQQQRAIWLHLSAYNGAMCVLIQGSVCYSIYLNVITWILLPQSLSWTVKLSES